MNRRAFAITALSTALTPVVASAHLSEATPEGENARENDSVDSRTRDLTRILQSVSPVALLESLEKSPVTNEQLIQAGAGSDPVSIPWADYGDTDLYSSLGGVIIAAGDTYLHDPDTEMLGGYIVYESADIAYHEFTRKLGDWYNNPSMTSAVAGTNVWVMESDEISIGTWRIGNVMMMALLGDFEGDIVEGIIGHLGDVATAL